MALEEHLEVLTQGVKNWNRWRAVNQLILPDLTAVALDGIDLQGANLSDVDLAGACISTANLREADLRGANLQESDLSHSNLARANLRGARCYKAHFIEVDFREADLTRANLNRANLNGANLKNARLRATQALFTNFENSIFTGARLEDWNINSATRLDQVTCDYIYLRDDSEERRPHDGNFELGEFTKLFRKVTNAVDLIFHNGVDWNAFAHSFRRLQVISGKESLSIQSIEDKGDGDFVIRLNASPSADKAAIQKFMKHEYQTALKVIENKYEVQLQAKEHQIEIYRQQTMNLWEVAKLAAGRNISIEAKALSGDNYNLENSDFGGGFAAENGIQTGGSLNGASDN